MMIYVAMIGFWITVIFLFCFTFYRGVKQSGEVAPQEEHKTKRHLSLIKGGKRH